MIHLRVFGGLTVEAPELSPNARARHRRPLALLALVAAGSPGAVGRNKLMAMLWPESDTARASNSLRQTLYQLRHDLGETLLLESAGGIQLDPAAVTVDLWKFRDAMERNEPGDAVAVYAGPFLEGFHVTAADEFSHWCEAERTRLAHQYVDALDSLARRAEEQDRFDDVVMWRRRQAGSDPLSSRVALSLLQALDAAGDRTGALEYASVYESLVRVHLQASPDPLVTGFVEALRRQPAATDTPGRRRASPAAVRRLEATGEAPIPELPSPPASRDSRSDRVVTRRPWLVAAAAVAIALVGATLYANRTIASPTAGTVVVLASGVNGVEGRDQSNRLVACTGPACPGGRLPQPAFVVAKHVAFTGPVAGTGFIAPIPDGTDATPPGYECCTMAVFENEFRLPADAVSARITISVLADNQARVAINGVEFGRQADSLASWNYGGPPTTLSATFPPQREGTNRLRVTLWDGGGAVGLHYHAVVTYERGIGDTAARLTAN